MVRKRCCSLASTLTGRTVAAICRVLRIGCATVYRKAAPRGPRYAKAADRVVTAPIREVIRTRATYGARRVHALVNRTFEARYNLKRIRRVMEINGWKLPRNARRRTGRAHTGQIQRAVSNERWCSDVLEIALKRDYVSGADRGSAAAVLEMVPAWIADYNAVAPHSALGFRAPRQYRAEQLPRA